MKKFTYSDIESWRPCYSPDRYLPKDWAGTALEILDKKEILFQDRLWVIMRTELVSEKLMRLFAVWCARQVQHLMKDERSINAIDVAEKFANGLATKEELATARATARGAARATARGAAWGAAVAAADDAAWAAADDAARAAARASQENKLREMLIAGVESGDTK